MAGQLPIRPFALPYYASPSHCGLSYAPIQGKVDGHFEIFFFSPRTKKKQDY